MRSSGIFAAVPAALAVSLSHSALAQTTSVPAGYRVRIAVPVTRAENGLAGHMELLTDARVQPDMDADEAYPLKPALLRLVGRDGRVLQKETLERSRASLDAKPLYGTARETCLLTVDYSAGMGSYNGPITFFVEVRGGHLQFLSVNGKRISVMQSLKTDWKLAPSTGGAGKDILEVRCRPNARTATPHDDFSKDFDVIYTRYHWNGSAWTRRARRDVGFWEDDGTFPPLSRFPR